MYSLLRGKGPFLGESLIRPSSGEKGGEGERELAKERNHRVGEAWVCYGGGRGAGGRGGRARVRGYREKRTGAKGRVEEGATRSCSSYRCQLPPRVSPHSSFFLVFFFFEVILKPPPAPSQYSRSKARMVGVEGRRSTGEAQTQQWGGEGFPVAHNAQGEKGEPPQQTDGDRERERETACPPPGISQRGGKERTSH